MPITTLVGSRLGYGPDHQDRQGRQLVTLPITSAIRDILWPLRGHHPEFVFTYEAQTTRDGRVQGQPLSADSRRHQDGMAQAA